MKELRDIVSPLQKEVLLLREKVASLQEEVRVLHAERPDDILHDDNYYSEPDQPSALGVRRGSRVRHLGTAYKSPYTAPGPRPYQPNPPSLIVQAIHTPVISKLVPQKKTRSKSLVDKQPQKKKSSKCLVDKQPENKPNPSPPIVEEGEATHAQAPVSMPLQHQKKKKLKSLIDKPPMVKPMLDLMWLSYKLPPSTIPPKCKLPATVKDNSAWATTAVDFYLHERGQGCYVDLCRIKKTYLLLERSWWGILLGVKSNGYLEDWHVDAWMKKLVIMRKRGNYGEVEERRSTIMPSSFSKVELEMLSRSSYQYDNGENGIHPKWWEIDKVYIPICSHNHWFLVELRLPSLEAVAYDSMFKYISNGVLENLCTRWTNLLPKFLDNLSYWKRSGNKKPKEFKFTIHKIETAPQQAKITRGDCGVSVCM
uniref:uncharacterized protein LOC122607394 n=1 Tax=Erigeron canadensis TaxID=72917 RepID=UPI001CB8C19A|nr:uncharacterized protein LOC122607394 [Erigeron canadensis]XP_043636294.1 uncharacterized protein LOC122607394 [Erigeron canadensis]XP_043636295.1 uncharacterized protein LOC122607394 [Erigeron canadensis]